MLKNLNLQVTNQIEAFKVQGNGRADDNRHIILFS